MLFHLCSRALSISSDLSICPLPPSRLVWLFPEPFVDPSVPRMKEKLKHVKEQRQGKFIPARAEDSLWERREPQVGAEEGGEGRKELPPTLFWRELGSTGVILGATSERGNAEWSKGRRFLKSFPVHTCALSFKDEGNNYFHLLLSCQASVSRTSRPSHEWTVRSLALYRLHIRIP